MTSLDTTADFTQQQSTGTPPSVRFSLDVGESTGAGLHRILLEQADLGAWHLERARLSDDHVHEVRKATKRVRAVLRMLSDDIDSRDYVRLNTEVRDLARELSQIRSAVVQVELLESLVADDGQLTANTLGLHEELVTVADRQRDGLKETVVESLSSRLAAVRSDIAGMRFHDEENASLAGVRRTYRRGRRSMTYAYGAPSSESFHMWRKQVKYLRHQMEIIEPGGGLAVSSLVSDLEEIGEGLGMGNDLADLERATSSVPPSMLSPSSRRHLNDVIRMRRAMLERGLKPIAASVYAAKPGVFAEQVIPRSA